MIRLTRNLSPAFLNPQKQQELTIEFIATEKRVWDIPELKTSLLLLSDGKCAYCECKLNEESKYMEVEHFKNKGGYPSDVMNWDNLLPACRRCNGKKGTHDVIVNPIIDPFKMDPRDHLKFRLYQFKQKTIIGRETIDALDLNNKTKVVQKRFEIGQKLQEQIDSLREKISSYLMNKTPRLKSRIISQSEALLCECQPESPYAATTSSVIHSDEGYLEFKKEMIAVGLWTPQLEDLHNNSFKYAMEFS